jgi:hypothetical protein
MIVFQPTPINAFSTSNNPFPFNQFQIGLEELLEMSNIHCTYQDKHTSTDKKTFRFLGLLSNVKLICWWEIFFKVTWWSYGWVSFRGLKSSSLGSSSSLTSGHIQIYLNDYCTRRLSSSGSLCYWFVTLLSARGHERERLGLFQQSPNCWHCS